MVYKHILYVLIIPILWIILKTILAEGTRRFIISNATFVNDCRKELSEQRAKLREDMEKNIFTGDQLCSIWKNHHSIIFSSILKIPRLEKKRASREMKKVMNIVKEGKSKKKILEMFNKYDAQLCTLIDFLRSF